MTLGAVEPASPPCELLPHAVAPESKPMWALAGALFSALDAAVRADGATLMAVYVPARFEVDDAEWSRLWVRYSLNAKTWDRDKVWRRFDTSMAALGVPVVDPRPALQQADEPTHLSDGLWTGAGHRIVAEQLADRLRREPPWPDSGAAALSTPSRRTR